MIESETECMSIACVTHKTVPWRYASWFRKTAALGPLEDTGTQGDLGKLFGTAPHWKLEKAKAEMEYHTYVLRRPCVFNGNAAAYMHTGRDQKRGRL